MSSDAYMKYRDEEDPVLKNILKGEMRAIFQALKKKIRERNLNGSPVTTLHPKLQAVHPIRVEARALDMIEQVDYAINQAKEISDNLLIEVE